MRLVRIVLVWGLFIGIGITLSSQVFAQNPPLNITCTGFELKNETIGAIIQSGSEVPAGTRVSYRATGCSAGWSSGSRIATVTNNNAFPVEHIQCASLGTLCITTAVYAGEGTRLYFRTNLLSTIDGNQYVCRYTGGWDSIPSGLAAPTGLTCGLGSGSTHVFVKVTESADNKPCYSTTDYCTSLNINNCVRAGSRYSLTECLRTLQATACKLNDTDYIVAVPSPSAKGWYENVDGKEAYVAGFSVHLSSTAVQSVEFRGLSFYCPDGPDKANGECTLNRIDIPPVSQNSIVKTFGTNSNFNFQLARTITQQCGAFQIDPYFLKINGQNCTKEPGTATYGVCNLINNSQKCNLPRTWRPRCSDPTPPPDATATPTSATPPLCVSITASKSPINYGDSVTFTCGLVPSAAGYEFRVIAPDGSIRYIPTASGNVSGEYIANGSLSGRYIAQCRVCPNAQLCANDRNYGWNNNPYLP